MIKGGYQKTLDNYTNNGEFTQRSWMLDTFITKGNMRIYNAPINELEQDIVFAGTIIFNSDIEIRRLIVGGDLYVVGNIFVKTLLRVDGNINAKINIKTSGVIQAGGDINVEDNIHSKVIQAGGNINAGYDIHSKIIQAGANIISHIGDIRADKDIHYGGSINAGGKIYINKVVYQKSLRDV